MAGTEIPLSDDTRMELQNLFKECSALFDGACTHLHAVIDDPVNGIPESTRLQLKTVAELLARSALPYDTLQARLLSPDNDPRHRWKCISPGMYDSTYQCERCGNKHVESIDNPATNTPTYGCPGESHAG